MRARRLAKLAKIAARRERWINRNKYYYELLNRLFRLLRGPEKGAEEKQYADHDLCSGKFSQRNHPKNSAMLSQDSQGVTVIRAGIMSTQSDQLP